MRVTFRSVLTAAVGAALLLAGCSTPPATESTTTPSVSLSADPTASTSPTPTVPAAAAQPTVNVRDGASNVAVDTVLTVTWPGVVLGEVKASASVSGKRGESTVVVPGTSPTKDTWSATEGLDPSAKYTMTISGKAADGKTVSATRSFTTQSLTLKQQAFPAIYPVEQGTFGVGMVTSVTFDLPVTDKATAQKHMVVTATPAQEGTWAWVSDTEVRYRPKEHWKPGTKVKIDLRLNGIKLGPNVWGQESRTFNLTIGREQTSYVDLKAKTLTVKRDGKTVQTFPISAGKAGFDTRNGVKMISARVDKMRMDSETTGIGGSEGYNLMVSWAMHLTKSGEYIHAAPWNSGRMGKVNASHGCTGMNTDDAYWLFANSLVGDLSVYTNGTRSVDWKNGYGDWNLTWEQYRKSSAT